VDMISFTYMIRNNGIKLAHPKGILDDLTQDRAEADGPFLCLSPCHRLLRILRF
jgi:hypothetical protein